ncbi:hypothetical protein N5A93_14690 [Roseovarius sp. EGI FJ00037]|uniref:hypothetical protein n=1 Tax=Roseovarius sp. TaxID=1486281 RepID=UPI0022A87572|nr:hypothetical protein [Roseovarius sp. EGI FJ00037]
MLGSGTAGLAAERHARREGLRALLIAPDFACTNFATVGCMPSKQLIAAAAEAAENERHAAQFGIHTAPALSRARSCGASAG